MRLLKFALLLCFISAVGLADTIAVNDPIFQAALSPFNWVTSGSSYVLATNPGAYIVPLRFNGTSLGIAVDVSALSGAGLAAKQYPRFKWRIDGGSYTTRQLLSSDTTISLASGLTDATHTVEIYLLATDAYVTRWNGVSSMKITGIVLGTGKLLEPSTIRTKRTAIFYGDSITEGAWSLGPPNDFTDYSNDCDGTVSYAKIIADWLGMPFGMCAFGGTSWDSTFNSDVPPLPSTYNFIKSGVSRTFNAPAYAFINMGTNGGVASSSTVATFLGNLRTACGSAMLIYIIIPFNQTGVTNITAGYNTYHTANPSDPCYLINLGSTGSTIAAANSTDGVHLTPTGHSLEAAQLELMIQNNMWAVPEENVPSGGWVPHVSVGVFGGIPTRSGSTVTNVTQSPFFADNTGASDASAPINAAIAASSATDVIFLPAGTYRCDGQIFIETKKITLRGAGPTTIVTFPGAMGTGIYIGRSTDFLTPINVTAGITKGSTTITVADTTGITTGRQMMLAYPNDVGVPVLSVNGYDPSQFQQVMLASKTGTTLTFAPPIYDNFPGTATVAGAQHVASGIGIESMTINANNNVQNVILAEKIADSWIKNVRINNAKNQFVYLLNALRFEITGSWFNVVGNGASPNGSGLKYDFCSACLTEDNIVYKAFPLVEVNQGSLGNAFAFNFLYDSSGIAMDDNHAPHNRFNLYEGNVASDFRQDGYYGSGSDAVVFRNRLTARATTSSSAGFAVTLNRASRKDVLAGNVLATSPADTVYSLGRPNLNNGSYYLLANFNAGIPWAHFKLNGTTPYSGYISTRTSNTDAVVTLTGTGTISTLVYPWIDETNANMRLLWSGGSRTNVRTNGTSGSTVTFHDSPQGNTVGDNMPIVNTPVTFWVGALGFQELDQAVAPSIISLWNWNAVDAAIPANEAPGSGQTFPDSILYPGGPPAYWSGTGLSLPAYNPASPSTRDAIRIPAAQRWFAAVNGMTTVTGRMTPSGTIKFP